MTFRWFPGLEEGGSSISVGNRLIHVEAKYRIPVGKTGEPFLRLVGQIESATASGEELVVFAAKESSAAELQAILNALSGDAAGRVTFVLGFARLAEFLLRAAEEL